MKKKIVVFCGVIFFMAIPGLCLAIDAWPAGGGTVIATLSDASGAVWHEGRESLFVVQNTGTLVELDSSGNTKDSWVVAGDLEGITLAENDRYLYIGIEHPDSIVEFDLQTEALTGKSWDLTAWMTGPDNSGLEGLAYRGGYFQAGLQADGKIYVFDVNLGVSGDVDYVENITPDASYTSDISAIEYSSKTGISYAIFDSYDALVELNLTNQIANHYSLPGSAQEGFAVKTNCLARTAEVYIANDDNGQIVKYTGYPITCLDADSDGVNYTADCNDYDATISMSQTYYRDIDGDGLGDAHATSTTCSFSSPEGYVSNSTDPADISASGRTFYINGNSYDLFGTDVTSVQHTDLNYYSDDWHEIIAVGLTGKRAYITVARVKGNEASIIKRRMLKKKYRTAQITTQISKNKFTTRFNGKKKYIWKMKSSGTFNRS